MIGTESVRNTFDKVHAKKTPLHFRRSNHFDPYLLHLSEETYCQTSESYAKYLSETTLTPNLTTLYRSIVSSDALCYLGDTFMLQLHTRQRAFQIP